MKKNTKKRLFEVMSRIDESFKPKLNEDENDGAFNAAGEPRMTHSQFRDYSEPAEPEYDDYEVPKQAKGIGDFRDIDWKTLHGIFIQNREALQSGSLTSAVNVGDLTDYDGYLTKDELNLLNGWDLVYNDGVFPLIDDDKYLDYNTFVTKAQEVWGKEPPQDYSRPDSEAPYMRGYEPMDEIGPAMASKTIGGMYGGDERQKGLLKQAFTSLFSQYVGRNLPFYLKVREEDDPMQYQLIEVVPRRDDKAQFGEGMIVDFHFHSDTENAVDDEAPYASYKKDLVLPYSIKEDDFVGNARFYKYNQYFVRFFIWAANAIRQTYFTYHPIQGEWKMNPETGREGREVNVEATREAKRSHLNKSSFQMFSFSSGNMQNISMNEASDSFPLGAKVQVSDGSGVASNKIGIVVSPREVKTDGSGIPVNVQGAYKPVDWSREVAVRLDDGELITMFKNRLTLI